MRKQPALIVAVTESKSDAKSKQAAFKFLRTNLASLKTTEQYSQAFVGLAACQQLLGNQEVYRKQLESMRKTLDSMCRIHVQDTDNTLFNLIQDVVPKIVHSLREDLEPDLFATYKDFFDALLRIGK